jgi:ubiquinone/menaquinone biosynthesis C-methylase UbiE
MNDLQLNADRFMGFSDLYEKARPKCPAKVKEIIIRYLNKNPKVIVDLGCGTGLSTAEWSNVCDKVIGIEPSLDMINTARNNYKAVENITFIQAFSDNTGIDDLSADVVTCSQAFHWMNPKTTLDEVSRVLKKDGVFSVYDCDWPPVGNWEAELEYNRLFEKVTEIESTHLHIKNNFKKWDKEKHLSNIKNSGHFRYVREVIFSNSETCNAERFIAIALSQGGLQSIIKAKIDEINPYLNAFKNNIIGSFGDSEFQIDFCYRMIIGVK